MHIDGCIKGTLRDGKRRTAREIRDALLLRYDVAILIPALRELLQRLVSEAAISRHDGTRFQDGQVRYSVCAHKPAVLRASR